MFENIRNETESAVQLELKSVWQNNIHCKCQQCLEDVYALTLNRLKPHYTNSSKGSIYTHVNVQQNKVAIIKAIADSMEIVGKSPRHERSED